MTSQFLRSVFTHEVKRFNIYREYCKSVSSEQRLKENPYFEKYADKIAVIQNASPEEFKQMLDEKFQPVRTYNSIDKQLKNNADTHLQSSKVHGQKSLDQIMKLETLADKSSSEIESIWKQYHQTKDGLFAVLPKSAYELMFSKLSEYPIFIFPLPRSQGYEFIMQQFLQHRCYFTSLINYQAYKENAPVCLTINYFTELMEDKGIVLMKGEFDDKALNAQEAQCLANQLQMYYGGKDEKKEKLLWTFNKQPETFKHMDLVSNLEYSFGK